MTGLQLLKTPIAKPRINEMILRVKFLKLNSAAHTKPV
jgi:hypothetical protein